jgi:hypothetical protein
MLFNKLSKGSFVSLVMTRLLSFLIVFLLLTSHSFSQKGYLFVKKGYHKKLTYVEGDEIHVKLQDGSNFKGTITLLRNDTVFINGIAVPRVTITEVLLDPNLKQPFTTGGKNALIVVGVAALTTITLVATKTASEEKALVIGMAAGLGALIIKYVGMRFGLFVRKKYKIGNKYHLQVLDFHLPSVVPPHRAF